MRVVFPRFLQTLTETRRDLQSRFCGIYKLNLFANLVACSLNPALEDCCDAKLRRNLWDGLAGIPITQYGGARYGLDRTNFGYVGQQVIMNAVYKMTIIGVSTDIVEWQLRNRVVEGR